MRYYIQLTIDLNDHIQADVDVYYDCVSRGCIGGMFEDAEGPEFEITEIDVAAMYGNHWDKSGRELNEWLTPSVMKRITEIVEDDNDLYECQYHNYMET